MTKIIDKIHNASTLRLVSLILSIMIGLVGFTLLLNTVSIKVSYINFISGADHGTELAINRGLRQAVSEGIISRKDLRKFLKDSPILVMMDSEMEVPGRFSRNTSNVILTFEENPSYNVIIHEAFHVALFASGLPTSVHHEVMNENDWCFGGCYLY